MKRRDLCLAPTLSLACSAFAQTARPAAPAAPSHCPALLDHRFPRLQDGTPQDLCQYAGRVLLVVNTASYCGFTKQYEGLEALYAQYREQGLVILGFPSNDFGQQEPGDAKQIAELCFNTYGVRFPMFDKSAVTGPQANPLYLQLREATGVSPRWNFHKYLIGRNGRVIAPFSSETEPMGRTLTQAVQQALSAKR
jgi:glutathione peroxidase